MLVPFNELQAPRGRYLEIVKECMRPDPEVKSIDLCCGLGFGKTILGIEIAALVMDTYPESRILFLEPDWARVRSTFLQRWQDIVPSEMYTLSVGEKRITWHNGAYLTYSPRVITGNKQQSRDRFKSIEFTAVIDDEAAIGFDMEQYQNTFARIRIPSKVRFYLTLSTPLVGPYGRFIKRKGNTLFRGRTADNFYLLAKDPTYESRQRANMSTEQARRELDGELVALEGRIWKEAKTDFDDPDHLWPKGNIHPEFTTFDPGRPWYLFCDLGKATGSYLVVQRTDPTYRGRKVFDGQVWVAIADLCPVDDASAARAFQLLDQHFGRPEAVVAGADVNSGDRSIGFSVSYFAQRCWGNIPVFPCREDIATKRVAYDVASSLVRTTRGERRLTLARDFRSLDPDSKRGLREMFDEDAFPPIDQRRESDYLPKGKDNVVQHTRDALLMGAYMVMCPPSWKKSQYQPA